MRYHNNIFYNRFNLLLGTSNATKVMNLGFKDGYHCIGVWKVLETHKHTKIQTIMLSICD